MGKAASSLGALNAAHASPSALANAAPNSRVGQVAAFARAMEAKDVDAAAQALANASNKSISQSTVESVNAILGLHSSPALDAAVAVRAAAIQRGDTVGDVGPGATTGVSAGVAATASAEAPAQGHLR